MIAPSVGVVVHRGLSWLAKLEWPGSWWTIARIAHYDRVSQRAVKAAIKAAREVRSRPESPPPFDLEPLFGILPHTPQSKCPHHGPLPKGSRFCCMICHRSGMDDHPRLQRSAATDPKIDPKPWTTGNDRLKSKTTRRQRRRRKDHPGRAA